MESHGLSYEDASALVAEELHREPAPRQRSKRARTMKVHPVYLDHIVRGYRRPSWDLAKAMAAATRGVVGAPEIMDYQSPADEPTAPAVEPA